MNCKNCGGELLYKNGIYLCNSCGATFSLDGVYENIDVCICYEESDSAGRRTRDSVIAQEVYRKLEESKIATFYERVSADGMAGDELETCKTVAINKAKIVIVLGTSVETFTTIQEKYTDYLNDKTVIPFCVDINPGVIPKTLSKIQAMSYSTIGWDKDLIKGIFNILGREQSVDTSLLYNRRRNKIIIVCISVVVVIAIAVTGWFILKPKDATDNASSTNETSAPETKPMSQKEIYDTANGLLDQGDFIGALQLFSQIPDHPNSSNSIKLIYAKYEGYYKSGDTNIHIDIVDNTGAIVKFSTLEEKSMVSFSSTAEIAFDIIKLECVDNLHRAIQMEIKLKNNSVELKLIVESNNNSPTITFSLSEKSDQPIIQLNKETFLGWLNNTYTISELRGLGYDIGTGTALSNDGSCLLGNIVGIDVEVSLTFLTNANGELTICGISAPAEYIAPELIGKKAEPLCKNDVIYWPNGYYTWIDSDCAFSETEKVDQVISKDTMIGIISKINLEAIDSWNSFFDYALDDIEKE